MRHQLTGVLLWLLPLGALAQPSSKVLVAAGREVTVQVLIPGTLECIGGTPTGNPLGPLCSPGTKRILLKDRKSINQYQEITGSAATLIVGSNVTITSCNLDENYHGQCGGHFEWTVPAAGGRWEGVWGGEFDMMTGNIRYSATGIGHGGQLEKMRMQYEGAYTGPGPGFFIVNLRDLFERR